MATETVLHATTVAQRGKAVLILGPSGAGKSGLALQLMALGAELVADDRTAVRAAEGQLIASCPPRLSGRIEARFVGILNARPAGPAQVTLVVDMGKVETERLPPAREVRIAEVSLPLLHKVESSHFPAAILQYLKEGPAPEAIDDRA
jgi:HPr kinase/phosphorylase